MSIIINSKHDRPEYAALPPGFVAEALEHVSAGRLNVLCYALAGAQMTTALNRRDRISPRHEDVRIVGFSTPIQFVCCTTRIFLLVQTAPIHLGA